MHTTSLTSDRMLGDIVTEDLRAAAVMERFGLDYCCGGQRSLNDACQAKSIAVHEVLDALAALGPATDTDILPAEWRELDTLTRYIVETHHRYVGNSIPAINASLDKLVGAHGKTHPELTSTIGKPDRGGVFIPMVLSRQELADLTGTTIETCIRIMSRWGKDEILRTERDGFVLLDRAALEQIGT